MGNDTFNFIVLEGADNVGKTTAVQYINDYYHSLGYEVINYRLPGGTPVGEIIRERIWKDNDVVLNDNQDTSILLMLACLSEIYADMRSKKNNNSGKIVFVLDRWMISMLTYHPDNNLFDENRICNHYFWEFNWITPSKVILLERDPELSIANYDLNDKQEKQFLLEDSITKHKKKFKNLFEYLKNTQSLTTALYNIQNSGSLDDLKKCIFNILDGEENG